MLRPAQGVLVRRKQDREQWLAMRRPNLNASDAGAVIVPHPHTSRFKLYQRYAMGIEPPRVENKQMRRGALLEPSCRSWIGEERPTWTISECQNYYCIPELRIGASPDNFVVDPARPGLGNVQTKTIDPWIFDRDWRDKETKEIDLPLWIIVQTLQETWLAGCSWAEVALVRVGRGIDIDLVEVDLQQDAMDAILERVAEFWSQVDARQEPAPDFAVDGDLIKRIAKVDGKVIDLTSNNRLMMVAHELVEARAREAAAKKDVKALGAELMHAMGDATLAYLAGGVSVSSNLVKRGGYTVQASEYRKLKLHGMEQET